MLRFGGERWLRRLQEAVPCGPVNVDIEDIFDDPQVVANGLVTERTHPDIPFPVKTTPVPWTFSRTPAVYGPLQGPLDEHRESVLADLRVGEGAASG
jgi:crotonobetainyl-CoA:carnitine CoA-transferase CaiB-like acyl-CoA transferase